MIAGLSWVMKDRTCLCSVIPVVIPHFHTSLLGNNSSLSYSFFLHLSDTLFASNLCLSVCFWGFQIKTMTNNFGSNFWFLNVLLHCVPLSLLLSTLQTMDQRLWNWVGNGVFVDFDRYMHVFTSTLSKINHCHLVSSGLLLFFKRLILWSSV